MEWKSPRPTGGEEWEKRIKFIDNDEYGIEIMIDGKGEGVLEEYRAMILDFIQNEIDKAREEGRKEVLKEVEYALAKDLRYELRFTEIKEVLSKLRTKEDEN